MHLVKNDKKDTLFSVYTLSIHDQFANFQTALSTTVYNMQMNTTSAWISPLSVDCCRVDEAIFVCGLHRNP